MTTAPSQPVLPPQEPASGPRGAFGALRAIRAAAALQAGSSAKHVLLALIAYTNFETWETHVGTTRLAQDTGLGYNTVARALDALEAAGVLHHAAPAKGRRAASYTLDLSSVESRSLRRDPTTGTQPGPDTPPRGPYADDVLGRVPTTGPQDQPVATPPRGPNAVGSPPTPRRVPTVGTNQKIIKPKAAPSDARVLEAAGSGAAAESREGSPLPPASPATPTPASPARTAPEGPRLADVAMPPLSPTNAPQGHAAGLAATPFGRKLIGLLKAAGVLSGDLWVFVRRVDFDHDLVAYILHRAKECKRRVIEGQSESITAHASRVGGLLRTLAKEPREGLAGFEGLTQQRQAIRTAAVGNVWTWHANQRGAFQWPEESTAVAAWAQSHDLEPNDAKGWARHLPVLDLDLNIARTGAAGCAKAWLAIVAGIKEQTS